MVMEYANCAGASQSVIMIHCCIGQGGPPGAASPHRLICAIRKYKWANENAQMQNTNTQIQKYKKNTNTQIQIHKVVQQVQDATSPHMVISTVHIL